MVAPPPLSQLNRDLVDVVAPSPKKDTAVSKQMIDMMSRDEQQQYGLEVRKRLVEKNMKMMKEHDELMRFVEKKEGKRENKIKNQHTMDRLQKDMDKTVRRLERSIKNAQNEAGDRGVDAHEKLRNDLEIEDIMKKATGFGQKKNKKYQNVKSKID